MIPQQHQFGSAAKRQSLTASISFFLVLLALLISTSNSYGGEIISMMAYNVENLFDATDDGALQGDVTFLPFSIKKKWATNKCASKEGFRRELCETLDWTQDKYEQRLEKVAKVLLGYNGGADIIVLEELENRRVIADLWYNHLRWEGYQFPIHFESPSQRGIDVGIISRFAWVGTPKAHRVDLSGIDPDSTRDVVEAVFRISETTKLRVTANHWPSLSHDVQARLAAANVVKKIALKSQREGVAFVALGDFNTLPEELPNPIENHLSDHNLSSSTRPLVDLQDYLGGYPNFPEDGSHYYRGEWSPLDRILISKNLFQKNADLKVVPKSFGLFTPSYLFKSEVTTDPETGEKIIRKIPQRIDFLTGEGYSDHLPVVLKMNIER